MNPVCTKCGKEMVCSKTGYCVGLKLTGILYNGDQYKCSSCGAEVVVGFGDGYRSESIKPDLLIGE